MAQVTLKGNPIDIAGNLPKVGDKAPDFRLTKSDFSEIKLADLAGKKVILNIFPSVDTGVCANSVRRFNQEAAKLNNVTVVCASADLPVAHSRFCAAEGISGVVSASTIRDHGFGERYGVGIKSGALEGFTARAIIVLDENGVVNWTHLNSEIAEDPDFDGALKAVS